MCIGKTGYILLHCLKVCQRAFLPLHVSDCRHAVCKLRPRQVRKAGRGTHLPRAAFFSLGSQWCATTAGPKYVGWQLTMQGLGLKAYMPVRHARWRSAKPKRQTRRAALLHSANSVKGKKIIFNLYLCLFWHFRVVCLCLSYASPNLMGNPAIAKLCRHLVDFVAHDKEALHLFSNAGTSPGRLAFLACIHHIVTNTEFRINKVSIHTLCQCLELTFS